MTQTTQSVFSQCKLNIIVRARNVQMLGEGGGGGGGRELTKQTTQQ